MTVQGITFPQEPVSRESLTQWNIVAVLGAPLTFLALHKSTIWCQACELETTYAV